MRAFKIFFKILSIILIIIILTIGATIGTIQYLLPSERIKIKILEYAEKYIDHRITIEDIDINIFKGISLNNIQISDSPYTEIPFAHVDNITLKYRLLPLLQKQIIIDKIYLTSPSLSLVQLSDSSWNYESFLKLLPADTLDAANEDTLPSPIFSLACNDIRISNASLHFDTGITGYIRGISIAVTALLDTAGIPSGTFSLVSQQDERPHILAIIPATDTSPEQTIKTDLLLDIQGSIKSIADISLTGRTMLNNLVFNHQKISYGPLNIGAEFKVHTNVEAGSFIVQKLGITFAHKTIATMSASITDFYTAPLGTLAITDGTLPLTYLNSSLTPLLNGIDLQGALSFTGTKIYFSSDTTWSHISGSLIPQLALTHFKGIYAPLPFTCSMANFSIAGLGKGSYSLLSTQGNAQLSTALHATDIKISLPNMQPLNFANFKVDALVHTNTYFMPKQIIASTHIKGPGTATLALRDTITIHQLPYDIGLKGTYELQNLNVTDLPVPLPATGAIDIHGSLACSSYTDMSVTAHLMTDSISILLDSILTLLPNVHLTTSFHGGFSDATFSQLSAKKVTVKIDDIFSLSATATATNFGYDNISAELLDFYFNCDLLHAYIPQSYKAHIPLLNAISLKGKIHASAQLMGMLPPPEEVPDYTNLFTGVIDIILDDITCSIPSYNTGISTLTSALAITLQPNDISLDATLSLYDVWCTNALPGTLQTIFATLKAHTQNLQDITLPKCTATIPDMGLHTALRGTLFNITSLPHAHLHTNVILQSDTMLSPIPEIHYQGESEIALTIQASANLAETLHVNGSASFQSFDLALNSDISIQNITGKLPFQQSLIIAHSQLLPAATSKPIQEGLQYLNFTENRLLFQKTLPQLGHLSINRISYGPYHIGALNIDAQYQDNRLDVRRVSIDDLYQGNLAGALQIDLAAGTLDKLLETISYGMAFQLAEIDADSLVLSIPLLKAIHKDRLGNSDEAKISADISFTGRGLDLSSEPQINGAINFSKIGSRVANDLLFILDPEQKDRSINQTRTLLKLGAHPKHMQFTVRQTFMYTSIYLNMPRSIRWNPLIHIPQPISYARMPIIVTMRNLGVF